MISNKNFKSNEYQLFIFLPVYQYIVYNIRIFGIMCLGVEGNQDIYFFAGIFNGVGNFGGGMMNL